MSLLSIFTVLNILHTVFIKPLVFVAIEVYENFFDLLILAFGIAFLAAMVLPWFSLA